MVHASLDGKLVIKAQLGNDFRRLILPADDNTLNDLYSMLQRIFADTLKPTEDFVLKYRDEENDLITVSTDEQLRDAIILSERQLRIVLVRNNEPLPLYSNDRKHIVQGLQQVRDTVVKLLDSLHASGDDDSGNKVGVRRGQQSHRISINEDVEDDLEAGGERKQRKQQRHVRAPVDAKEFDPLAAHADQMSTGNESGRSRQQSAGHAAQQKVGQKNGSVSNLHLDGDRNSSSPPAEIMPSSQDGNLNTHHSSLQQPSGHIGQPVAKPPQHQQMPPPISSAPPAGAHEHQTNKLLAMHLNANPLLPPTSSMPSGFPPAAPGMGPSADLAQPFASQQLPNQHQQPHPQQHAPPNVHHQQQPPQPRPPFQMQQQQLSHPGMQQPGEQQQQPPGGPQQQQQTHGLPPSPGQLASMPPNAAPHNMQQYRPPGMQQQQQPQPPSTPGGLMHQQQQQQPLLPPGMTSNAAGQHQHHQHLPQNMHGNMPPPSTAGGMPPPPASLATPTSGGGWPGLPLGGMVPPPAANMAPPGMQPPQQQQPQQPQQQRQQQQYQQQPPQTTQGGYPGGMSPGAGVPPQFGGAPGQFGSGSGMPPANMPYGSAGGVPPPPGFGGQQQPGGVPTSGMYYR